VGIFIKDIPFFTKNSMKQNEVKEMSRFLDH
jgi:hypothetical protein